jgi:serine protease Do
MHRTHTTRLLTLLLIASATGISLAQPMADATAEDFAFARRLSRVFKTVAEKSEASVVHITQFRKVTPVDMFGQQIGRAQERQTGLGSGVIVDPSGVVLTNNHVIAGASQLRIKLSDGTDLPAELIGRDELTDLAVLRFNPESRTLRAATFDNSDELEVGEWVIAVGSPFGLDNSVTQGIVSAKGRSVSPGMSSFTFEDYIQTDAAINPGNSGGPLFNLEGKVVGINSAIASRSGGYDGIGFSIPSNTAKAILDNIVKNGRVVRGWLGVETSEENNRVTIQKVVEESPAAAAGLKSGDIITRVEGTPISDSRRLQNTVGILSPGTTISIDIQRDGAPVRLSATLRDLPTQLAGSDILKRLGIEITEVTPEIARQLGLRRPRGVLITEVRANSLASGKLSQGDVIVAISDEPIVTLDDFTQELAKVDLQQGTRFNVVRGGMRGYVDLVE